MSKDAPVSQKQSFHYVANMAIKEDSSRLENEPSHHLLGQPVECFDVLDAKTGEIESIQ